MSLSIIIADDHDIIREGIKSILSGNSNYKIEAEAKDGEELLEKIKKHKPDIALLDISMPKTSGLDAIEQIHYLSPKTKILILTIHKATPYIIKAFEKGVKGYLQKESAGEELLPALSKIAAGNVYLTSAVSSDLVDRALEKSMSKIAQSTLLTSREKEILRLVAEGKTSKEIADTLYISHRTVENHKNAILKKLDLHRTSDLIKYAIKHKIVEIEEY